MSEGWHGASPCSGAAKVLQKKEFGKEKDKK
jgi:hypothetical protein